MQDLDPINSLWTEAMSETARAQGWDLSDHDGTGLLEIRLCPESSRPFGSDDEARRHVAAVAVNGDRTAVAALAIHVVNLPTVLAYEGEASNSFGNR